MEITIRETIEKDVKELTYIQQRAFLPVYEKYQDVGNPALRGKEDILYRLDRKKRFLYYTILVNDNIVGGILYRIRGNGTFFTELRHNECYIQRVYIDPEYQRKGIAHDALKYCEEKFVKHGFTYFCVDFPQSYTPSRALFTKLQFADSGKTAEVEQNLIVSFFEKRI